jgi:hypothetical protein
MPKSPLLTPALAILALLAGAGCSLLATRPYQDMSDTAAALRAAREVQADVLAPELYRQAGEWFFKAKHEYKFKNFELARKYATKARIFAEDAEFEAIRNGGNRSSTSEDLSDPLASGITDPSAAPTQSPTSAPYDYPTPTGTPVEAYAPPSATGTPTPAPATGTPPAPAPAPAPLPSY